MGASPVEASVVVIALNAAEHIEEQLVALSAQQTDVSWELVVSDNGSTDSTRAIVERYASEFPVPVRVVDASARRGISPARNIGVAASAGDLLLFADADDVVDERWVDEMVRALREHPFVGGRLEVLELNGEEVACWRPHLADGGLPKFGGRPWAVGCNFGCTVAAFRVVGGFQETVSGWDDMDFAMAMDAHGMPAFFAERAIVHYRYRRVPREAVAQMWVYGRMTGPRYARYGVEPPTFLDVAVIGSRSIKQGLRERLQGLRPVRPAVDLAYVLGEASMIWRSREFWQPVHRHTRVVNPLLLQRDRLARLARSVRARRGSR